MSNSKNETTSSNEYVVILEFFSGNIYYGPIGEDEKIEDYLEKHNLREDDCYWMYTIGAPNFINIDKKD